MMRFPILAAIAAAILLVFAHAPNAEAAPVQWQQFQNANPMIQEAACVTRRIRTVRPNGRVVYRTVQRCGVPAYGRPMRGYRGGCRTVRERIVRPNGRVIYRQVRRC
jgi:hypothetical protein